MIKLCVVGISGRMGQALLHSLETPDFQGMFDLVGAVEKKISPTLNHPVPSFPDISITSDIQKAGHLCDIVIDFSCKDSVEASLDFAVTYHKKWLCGVTDLSESFQEKMKEAARKIPIFYAPNMSLGIAVLRQALKLAARNLPHFDIEINESHHRNKKDAPSGTALMLAKTITDEKQLDPKNSFCFSHYEHPRSLNGDQIGFSIIRGGSLPGTHTVYFLGSEEELSFTHRSYSRHIFARGALTAALWLNEQKPGLYSMSELMMQPARRLSESCASS